MLPRSLLALWGAGVALAHSPHDAATVLSVAPNGAILTNDSDLIALSVDGGQTFSFRFWPDGAPSCLLAEDEATWVVGSAREGAFETTDGGASFRPVEEIASVTACAADAEGWLVGGPEGIWASEGAGWTLLGDPGGSPVSVGRDADGVYAVLEDGGLVELGVGTIAPDALVVASDGVRTLVGRSDGPLLVREGSAWSVLEGSPEGVRVLHVAGGLILAATGTEAVWRSEDGGQSWALFDAGLDELALGWGGPGNDIHYYGLGMAGESEILASFEGLYRWEEDRWVQGELDTVPRVRSVWWTPSGKLLVGAYGGGVYEGTPGGDDWREIAVDPGWPYPKQIRADEADEGWRFVVSGSVLYLSANGGESWDTAKTSMAESGDAMAPAPGFPADPRLAVAGRVSEGDGSVAWSTDAGATWGLTLLGAECQAKPSAVAWDEGDRLWAACGTGGALYRSVDGGQSFEEWLRMGTQINHLSPGELLVLGTDDGLWRLDPEGDHPDRLALEGESITALARDAAGEAWVGIGGVGVARVSTGGQVTELRWPDGDLVEDIRVSATGDLAVGLRSGAWWSADEGLSWSRACAYDRIDESLQQWWGTGWSEISVEGAMRGGAWDGKSGARATLITEGEQIRIIGGTSDHATLWIEVDGVGEEVEFTGEGELETVYGVDLPAGTHQLDLEVREGLFRLDGAERWLSGAPPLPPGPDAVTPTRCGCRGGASGALLLLLLPMSRRRRRTEEP